MQILKRLFLLLSPYWKTIIISAVLLVGRAGLELVPPLFQKSIVDEVITARDLSYLAVLIFGLIGAYILHQVVQIGDNYLRHTLGEKLFWTCESACMPIYKKCLSPFLSELQPGN